MRCEKRLDNGGTSKRRRCARLIDRIKRDEPFLFGRQERSQKGKRCKSDRHDVDGRGFERDMVRQMANGAVVVVFEIAVAPTQQMEFGQS